MRDTATRVPPFSLAPIAYTLYQHFIKHDPNDPNWEGRDRFILSGGHASLTQYVQLYFSGYGLTLDDLKNFRGGADTRTPGHPEYGLTPGIEMTTGPLGQGFASAIGFAYGQRFQRGLLDPEAPAGESPFDHNIWVICGEGDIEEGISGEAASLAANQQLGNLTVIFDANRIQIEGDTNLVLAEDVLKRFQAYGWYTDEFSFIQPDGSYKEDVEGLADTIAKARAAAPNQPKLIKVDTLIAWPTPGKTDDPSSHGSKLGAEAVAGLEGSCSATTRRSPSTSTKRPSPTPARSPSAVSKPTRNGTRSTTHGARPTRTRLPCTTASRPASFRKASTRPSTTSRPPSKSARTSPPVALPAPL